MSQVADSCAHAAISFSCENIAQATLANWRPSLPGNERMRYTRLIPFWLVLLVLTFRPCAFGQESSPTPTDAAKPNRFLRFANRAHVELKGTRGLLNLNGSFTVEAWLRWEGAITTPLYLMGDEIWKDMAAELPKVP